MSTNLRVAQSSPLRRARWMLNEKTLYQNVIDKQGFVNKNCELRLARRIETCLYCVRFIRRIVRVDILTCC